MESKMDLSKITYENLNAKQKGGIISLIGGAVIKNLIRQAI